VLTARSQTQVSRSRHLHLDDQYFDANIEILVDRTGKDAVVFQLPGRKPSNPGACSAARFPHNINTEARTPLIYAASCAKCSDDGPYPC
jgi:hypothetical protein